jgi:outer membrane protein assembly factor BamB
MLVLEAASLSSAADWPTYQGDFRRSGVARESIDLPLRQAWVFRSPHAPRPAWPDPAKRDVLNRHENLRALTTFDRAFQVVAASDRVYFGSSADDKLYALDAETGRVAWAFFSGGPVRLAPTVVNDRVYFGSDDGWVYCLDARDGRLRWKYTPAETPRALPGNGRMISPWPVRTSVVVDGGVAYFAAGLFPGEKVYLVALNADDGTLRWKREAGVSAQGYLLASDERLYLPTGRTSPAIFARADGKPLGKLPGAGGAYALLTAETILSGPGLRGKELSLSDPRTAETIASFDGLRMVVRGRVAFMQSETRLTAFDRLRHLELSSRRNGLVRQERQLQETQKRLAADPTAAKALEQPLRDVRQALRQVEGELQRCNLWSSACDLPYAMILADNGLVVGGDGQFAVLSPDDGRRLAAASVSGKAYALSLAGGRLFVGTDQGTIHCFHGLTQAPPREVRMPLVPDADPADEPSALYARAAQLILEETGQRQGYCLLLGCHTGRLAHELARKSALQILGVERDAAKVAAARASLDKAGCYGVRVTVHEGDPRRLPYPSGFANLIVCEQSLTTGELPSCVEEVARLLRPCGGRVVLLVPRDARGADRLRAWGEGKLPHWEVVEREALIMATARRDALAGSGQWTHTYADPANTACSGDRLVGGTPRLQWFGEPGPRRMVDRHSRNVPPLYRDGRLFVPGDEIVYAVDAYNGTPLWQIETPGSRRVGVFLDSSNLVVDEERLYLAAGDECRAFDVRSGKQAETYRLPALPKEPPREWGYLARAGALLLGSARAKGATYQRVDVDAALRSQPVWYPNMKLALSTTLLALELPGGQPAWSYQSGRMIDATFTATDRHVCFLESHSPAALADTSGRLPMRDLNARGQTFLVALDRSDGQVAFKRPVDLSGFQQPTYLSFAENVLLLSGCRIDGGEQVRASGETSLRQIRGGESIRYCFQAFDARSGKPLWEGSHPTRLAVRGGHGEYNQHPTILGPTAYTWPYAYDLATGKRIGGWTFDRRGHGCGLVSGSDHCLFWRGGNPWMYDLRPGGGPRRLNEVSRPGCFINILPAGGLILIPEASSGCTCPYPLQTSMAFGCFEGPSGK